MVDDVRPRAFEGGRNRCAIGQVDSIPGDAVHGTRGMTTRAMPGDDPLTVSDEQVDEMSAGETGGAGDEGRDHRGMPLIAPLNGEKLPRPASVKERKKRRTGGYELPNPA